MLHLVPCQLMDIGCTVGQPWNLTSGFIFEQLEREYFFVCQGYRDSAQIQIPALALEQRALAMASSTPSQQQSSSSSATMRLKRDKKEALDSLIKVIGDAIAVTSFTKAA